MPNVRARLSRPLRPDADELFYFLDPTTGRLYSYNTKDGAVQAGPQAGYKSAAGKSILKVARFVAQPWRSLLPSLFGAPEPLQIKRRMPKDDKKHMK